jgi:phytoene desaturase
MVRTVPGPTDRVVVVGAGLAGLSAALRLRGAGREVTVVERGSGPGGRAGRVEERGYALDTGPSVFTAPELIADALAAVGEKLDDRLTLVPLGTTYRAQFADGSHLDVHADVDAFAAEVAALCGPAEAAALRRYLADLAALYRLQRDTFIDRNLDTPLDLLGPELVRLVRRGGFGRLSNHVTRFFTDDRLRRLFSFQALYAGVSPFRAIAAYAVIAQLDIGAGVWHPVGGIAAVPRALAAAAAGAGVVLRYDAGVRELETSGRRVTGVVLDDGERLPADAVVVTVDRPELLVPGFSRRRRPVYSPSCVALHLGVRAELPGQAHHTISFGAACREAGVPGAGGGRS